MKLNSLVGRRWKMLRPQRASDDSLAPRDLAIGHVLGRDAKPAVQIRPSLFSRPCEVRRS